MAHVARPNSLSEPKRAEAETLGHLWTLTMGCEESRKGHFNVPSNSPGASGTGPHFSLAGNSYFQKGLQLLSASPGESRESLVLWFLDSMSLQDSPGPHSLQDIHPSPPFLALSSF